MRTITFIGIALALVFFLRTDRSTAQTAAPGALPPSDAPLPPGMTPLFDGKTFAGWAQFPPDHWTIKQGILASMGLGRGVIYTTAGYDRYRLVFDIRHAYGKPDHHAAVLVFCATPKDGEKVPDALEGIQFQVPTGGTWDYRQGKNNDGKAFFTRVARPKFDERKWSRVELLVDAATGTAQMAVAQPPGAKAVVVTTFKDPAAGRKGPIAFQMHNKGLFDEFVNIAIEPNPATFKLLTTGDEAK
jgi:hypothetical protein